MSKERPPSRTAEQFVVRFPDGMRDRIAEAAKASNRSMNAEIVARLDESLNAADAGDQAFQDGFETASLRIEVERLRNELHAERMRKMNDRATADSTGKMLEALPVELVSQYGLHLYREQMDRIRQETATAHKQYQPLYEELQRLITSNSPPGPTMRAKEALSAVQKRIFELEEQARVIEQTISGIHTYRKVYGLPELRNIQQIATLVQVKRSDASKPTPAKKKPTPQEKE